MVGPRHARMTTPPPAPGIIERPRLVPLLHSRPVVVLAGMAGYGKSTLLSAVASRPPAGGATLWLTVDDSDRDPVCLVSDLMTAASLSGPDDLVATVESLRVPALRAEPLTLVDSLLEVFYEAGMPVTLVLDDLQHLTRSEASTQVIDHVLRWAPANMRIALAARVVPQLRLQRLRLDDRLAYLAHDELAFSAEETAEAVRAAGLDLAPEIVDSIHRATGGWPAGVRMAILAAGQDGPRPNVPTHLRRARALADYLAIEVLAALTDDVRRFILDSSLDDHVCPSLIDAIRHTHNAEVLLEKCLADGLFRSRDDAGAGEPWYQWHPLFAAHMRRRLISDHPERATALHAAAAAWWASVDAPTAIGHAMAAGDGELASRIFSDRWLELFLQGRADAVLATIDQLPPISPHAGDTHLAKALILLQRGRIDDARSAITAARALADLLPSSHKVRFEDRMAAVEDS